MAQITDTLAIRRRVVKNRIAMLPVLTFSFDSEDGNFYGEQHVSHYTEIAAGGAGLVVVQGTDVTGARSGGGKWTPGSRESLRAIASGIKSRGAAALIQLSFSGDRVSDVNAYSTKEISARQDELLAAAIASGELGFDGVEFHFAHGYFLCRMLDASLNKRKDDFGGSMENRARIVTDIIPEIRANAGDDFIIGARMGAFIPSEQNGVSAAKNFESSGVDFLDITFGVEIPPGPVPADFPFSPVTYSGYLIKQNVNIPVIGVYGLRTEEQVRALVERGYADIAGVARGILADPCFPERVLKSKPVNICRSCRDCQWFTNHTKCPARKAG
jgi:2,4-dienoyl-CoA reductase-like NADH-dependent reductase (Old Yellow Enzyme family)